MFFKGFLQVFSGFLWTWPWSGLRPGTRAGPWLARVEKRRNQQKINKNQQFGSSGHAFVATYPVSSTGWKWVFVCFVSCNMVLLFCFDVLVVFRVAEYRLFVSWICL